MNAPDNLTAALDAREKGLVAIPCYPLTKVPSVRWKRWQKEKPPMELLRAWFENSRNNIAIVTTGMVVFDCDDPEKADLVLAACGETPHKLLTPSGGIHLGYRKRKGVAVRNQVKIKGLPIDIRTDGGLELVPNSRTEEGKYEWLGEGLHAISELPVARVGWTRERTRRRAHRSLALPGELQDSASHILHPEAYCLQVPSVQGENGSRGLVRVVSVLRDAGRTPAQIFDFITNVWGPRCARPVWSDREVWHAIHRHCGTA